MNIKNQLLITFSFFILISQLSMSQSVEIHGQAKVTEMTNDDGVDDIVVRKPDGTLATRSAQSLPSSFEDTTRSLNTDFELAKHICDCGTDLPPYLIESLLDAGYSSQDLIKAGVPLSNLTENLQVVDLDGNEYDVINIGTQKWLKQNLKVTQYNDGTPIDLRQLNADWTLAIDDEEAAYSYPDGDIINVEEYGLIYTSYTTLPLYNGSKNICPTGWQVPTREDLDTLRDYIEPGSSSYSNTVGSFLKKIGTDQWTSPNLGANNILGFSGVGAGSRWHNGSYTFFGTRNYFNTQSLSGSTAIFGNLLENDEHFLRLSAYSLSLGAGSVRCMKE